MYVGGSGGGIAMFVLALLSAMASLAECYSYYTLIPKVEFYIDRRLFASTQGDYVTYGQSADFTKLLYVVDDPFFGCTDANDTDIPSYPSQSAFLLPENGHCSNTEKSTFVSDTYNARGVFLYRLSDADDEDRERRQTARRTSQSSSGPTIIKVSILTEQLTQLLTKQRASSTIQVNVEAQLIQRGFRTTQTFYFVVFAFCILMLLSCSWLLLSYFRRCHYRWRVRRNQARSANETRQMMNRLPTKSYKTSKEKGEIPTCVVCLEVFKNHESIRILPCKHEFHKKCIDPWLKMKRTCPMCKQDVFPSKRRRSSESATGQRNTARGTSQDPTAALITTAAHHQRSRSWSSNSTESSNSTYDSSSVTSSNAASNTTQETDTSATLLLGDSSSGHGEVRVITFSPVDSTVHGIEMEVMRDDAATVEVDMSGVGDLNQGQQQHGTGEGERRDQGASSSVTEHVGVDIEGMGPLHPAPIVIT